MTRCMVIRRGGSSTDITAEQLEEAKEMYEKSGRASRVYKDFSYKTLKTWSRERRLIGKAESGFEGNQDGKSPVQHDKGKVVQNRRPGENQFSSGAGHAGQWLPVSIALRYSISKFESGSAVERLTGALEARQTDAETDTRRRMPGNR